MLLNRRGKIYFAAVLAAVVGLYVVMSNLPTRLAYPLKHREAIETAAGDYHIPPSVVAAVIFEESRFDPNAVSASGAIGLMQLIPQTAAWVSEQSGVSLDTLEDPEVNVLLGTWYLDYLLRKYGDIRLALAAYNWGETNVDKWIKRVDPEIDAEVVGSIPVKETREYVQRVLNTRSTYIDTYGLQ